jgi:hypothetical protein
MSISKFNKILSNFHLTKDKVVPSFSKGVRGDFGITYKPFKSSEISAKLFKMFQIITSSFDYLTIFSAKICSIPLIDRRRYNIKSPTWEIRI